jgi:TetR/AcrR family transcriptional regulator
MSKETETEKKILDAARIIFERDGFNGARMQKIADEAGISKASLHYYFRSKQNLFDRIFDDTVAKVLPIISTWEDTTEDWETKLRQFIPALFRFFAEGSMLFLIQELNRNPTLLAERRTKGKKQPNKLVQYFEALSQTGTVSDIDPKLLYIIIHSLCSYPIMNKTMFSHTLRMSDSEYEQFLADYPEKIAGIIISIVKTYRSDTTQ